MPHRQQWSGNFVCNGSSNTPGGQQNAHISVHPQVRRPLFPAEHSEFLRHCCGQDPLNRALLNLH